MNRSRAQLLLSKFIEDENGQALSEYGGTLAMMSIMAAALFFGALPIIKLTLGSSCDVMCNSLNRMAAGATQGMM